MNVQQLSVLQSLLIVSVDVCLSHSPHYYLKIQSSDVILQHWECSHSPSQQEIVNTFIQVPCMLALYLSLSRTQDNLGKETGLFVF